MLKPVDATKHILLDIAGFLSYFGFGISLWQLTTDLLVIAVYALLIFYLLLALHYLKVKQELRQLQEKFEATEEFTAEPQQAGGLFEDIPDSQFYTTEHSSPDTGYDFSSFQEEYIIHVERRVTFKSRFGSTTNT